jgi:hypothetical protein
LGQRVGAAAGDFIGDAPGEIECRGTGAIGQDQTRGAGEGESAATVAQAARRWQKMQGGHGKSCIRFFHACNDGIRSVNACAKG